MSPLEHLLPLLEWQILGNIAHVRWWLGKRYLLALTEPSFCDAPCSLTYLICLFSKPLLTAYQSDQHGLVFSLDAGKRTDWGEGWWDQNPIVCARERGKENCFPLSQHKVSQYIWLALLNNQCCSWLTIAPRFSSVLRGSQSWSNRIVSADSPPQRCIFPLLCLFLQTVYIPSQWHLYCLPASLLPTVIFSISCWWKRKNLIICFHPLLSAHSNLIYSCPSIYPAHNKAISLCGSWDSRKWL